MSEPTEDAIERAARSLARDEWPLATADERQRWEDHNWHKHLMEARNAISAAGQCQPNTIEIATWIAYADKLESVLELVCGESKDKLKQMHAKSVLSLVRPSP